MCRRDQKNVALCQQKAFDFWLKIIRSHWSDAQNNILDCGAAPVHILHICGGTSQSDTFDSRPVFIGNNAVRYDLTHLEKKNKSVFNKNRHISIEDIRSESDLNGC